MVQMKRYRLLSRRTNCYPSPAFNIGSIYEEDENGVIKGHCGPSHANYDISFGKWQAIDFISYYEAISVSEKSTS